MTLKILTGDPAQLDERLDERRRRNVLEYMLWYTRHLWKGRLSGAPAWVALAPIYEYFHMNEAAWPGMLTRGVLFRTMRDLVERGQLEQDGALTLYSSPGAVELVDFENRTKDEHNQRVWEAQSAILKAIERFGGTSLEAAQDLARFGGNAPRLEVVGADNILALAEALKRSGGGG